MSTSLLWPQSGVAIQVLSSIIGSEDIKPENVCNQYLLYSGAHPLPNNKYHPLLIEVETFCNTVTHKWDSNEISSAELSLTKSNTSI